MPLQLYDKEQILDACLTVFARHGYEKTSTVMLAEAAGISRSLIFHHFKSKKDLYLCLLDQCFEKGKAILGLDSLLECEDFFEAKEKFSMQKLDLLKKNPDLYKVLTEAFTDPPDELKAEIEEKFGALFAEKDKMWQQLFEKVPLREGVDRGQAFQLIMLILDYFGKKYLLEIGDKKELDETKMKRIYYERNSFLAMIRYGIEK